MAPNARIEPKRKRTFQRRLLRWFERHGRDLPWRRTRDPYAILVSEVMLQQTPVDRVLPYYDRFLKKYPTVEELATARATRVREAWDGLGYYARARNIHATAKHITKRCNGLFPESVEEMQKLPGVGRYTAGAIISFAFEKDASILDTNVKRLLSRIFLSPRRGRGSRRPAAERELWALAEALLPRGQAWAFNQALMDFGATVCTARAPRCPHCCMTDICRTYPTLARTAERSRNSR